VAREITVAEPPAVGAAAPSLEAGEGPPRRAFASLSSIPAGIRRRSASCKRVLHLFAVLGWDKSIEFVRHHQERIGREPIIGVHNLAALGKDGTQGCPGRRQWRPRGLTADGAMRRGK